MKSYISSPSSHSPLNVNILWKALLSNKLPKGSSKRNIGNLTHSPYINNLIKLTYLMSYQKRFCPTIAFATRVTRSEYINCVYSARWLCVWWLFDIKLILVILNSKGPWSIVEKYNTPTDVVQLILITRINNHHLGWISFGFHPCDVNEPNEGFFPLMFIILFLNQTKVLREINDLESQHYINQVLLYLSFIKIHHNNEKYIDVLRLI